MFNNRQNLDKIIRQQVEDFFGPSLVLESVIHRYVGVAEATAMKKGVVESSTTSSATFDFMKLCNELMPTLALDKIVSNALIPQSISSRT
jgi:cellulose biosynthesis protein BcsQ